jgi:hypothetical protein
MSDLSPRLDLPFLLPSQAGKHITYNEAMAQLDALVQLRLQLPALGAPPAQPDAGAVHVVAAGASGEWAGQEGRLAVREAGGWRFVVPRAGWQATVAGEARAVVFDGAAWVDQKAVRADAFGIGTPADATNRLAVRSPAALFTHDGTDQRCVINKAAPAHVAALLFQTGFQTRAELGLTGSDAFSLKVTPAGQGAVSALHVDPVTRRMGLWTDAPEGSLHIVRAAEHIVHDRYDETTAAAAMRIRKARGTVAAPATVLAEDAIAAFSIAAHDGGGFRTCGALRWVADGAPAQGQVPTRIEFHTARTPVGQLESARLTSQGDLAIGLAQPTARLHVAGVIRTEPVAKAALPTAAATGAGGLAWVSDAAGGAGLFCCDGSAWRRVSDGTVLS